MATPAQMQVIYCGDFTVSALHTRKQRLPARYMSMYTPMYILHTKTPRDYDAEV